MELTKGKWKASRSATGSWKVDTDDALIAKEIRECNVYAIAAVPELVEACEKLLEEVAWLTDGEGCDHSVGIC